MPKDNNFIPRVLMLNHECCICLERKGRRMMVDQPCLKSDHKICKSCIERIALTIPISLENPDIYCQYPWFVCNHKYRKRTLKNILKDKYDLFLSAHLAYKHNEYIIKTCTFCSGKLFIDKGDIEEMGYNIMICSTCKNDICIDCLSGDNLVNCVCTICIDTNEYTNTNSFNHFFHKEDGDSICDYKIKNMDVSKDLALRQIINRYIPDPQVELHVNCPVCKVSIYKTEQCNGIKHCHVEICYSCGKFSDIGVSLEDHWSARGDRGCPRFDQDPFWHSVSEMKCIEGVCYGHNIGPCTVQDHLDSILKYQEFRKKQHMYHSLKSLLPHIRQKVIDEMPENLCKYLPPKGIFHYLDDNPCDYEARQEYKCNIM